jgi:hypothetical protein
MELPPFPVTWRLKPDTCSSPCCIALPITLAYLFAFVKRHVVRFGREEWVGPELRLVRQDTTVAAFRKALEVRLQGIAKREAVDLQRLRRQVAFDRFLARLFMECQVRTLPWILKGGYAMESRIRSARTTKEIDR